MNNSTEQSKLRLLCSVSEALDALAIGRTKLYQMLETGELDSVQIGSRRLIKIESLQGFVARSAGEAE